MLIFYQGIAGCTPANTPTLRRLQAYWHFYFALLWRGRRDQARRTRPPPSISARLFNPARPRVHVTKCRNCLQTWPGQPQTRGRVRGWSSGAYRPALGPVCRSRPQGGGGSSDCNGAVRCKCADPEPPTRRQPRARDAMQKPYAAIRSTLTRYPRAEAARLRVSSVSPVSFLSRTRSS